jgi:hypothetical protein
MKIVNIKQNTTKWQHCTNRHPTTRGFSWGWIEGASHHETWSDDPDSKFKSADASRVVTEHNAWLENIRPVELKLIDERNKESALTRQIDEREVALKGLHAQRDASRAKIAAWEAA